MKLQLRDQCWRSKNDSRHFNVMPWLLPRACLCVCVSLCLSLCVCMSEVVGVSIHLPTTHATPRVWPQCMALRSFFHVSHCLPHHHLRIHPKVIQIRILNRVSAARIHKHHTQPTSTTHGHIALTNAETSSEFRAGGSEAPWIQRLHANAVGFHQYVVRNNKKYVCV